MRQLVKCHVVEVIRPLEPGECLLALERIPEARLADGYRFANAQAVHKHVWAEREYLGRKEPTPSEECGSQESR
jgi:hypothetical protein